ncbi:MAG: HAMP domain-containing histidine kinase [Oscillospiraceae bacterium]|nr:HAMP domain-containing histidine kinase [Oscillospiraceae bacterium]
MKSAFLRQMLTITLIVFLTLLILGGILRLSFHSYLEREERQALAESVKAVTELTQAYGQTGPLEENWDFHISLGLSSRVSKTDVLYCDESGKVKICACEDLSCEHLLGRLEESVLRDLQETGELTFEGTLSGIYTQRRYIHMVQDTYGIVVVSSPAKTVAGTSEGLFMVFLYTAILVCVLGVGMGFLYSRYQVRPLREMASAARKFGHGDFSVRAKHHRGDTREMEELVSSFNNMADILQRGERQRQDFVANVSHELKTPMTTIAGYLDGMLDGTIPCDDQKACMEIVSREVRRMSRLVRSMLEISRMQSQGVDESQLSRFDVGDVAVQALLTFESKLKQKNLNVIVDVPEKAFFTVAHKDGITQVLHNLIDNAIKFSNPQGDLIISLKKEGGKLHLSVENTGATIPEEELPLIFDRFHKLDKSRSEDPSGVGLGLYIVKTIVGAHGENIWVTSHDGKTIFTFTLPHVK